MTTWPVAASKEQSSRYTLEHAMRLTVRTLLLVALPLLACASALVPLGADTAIAEPDDAPLAPAATTDQLDELVAPVALYPDVVLDSLLPATVAPVDVAAAARFVASQGGRVQAAPRGAAWDVGLVALLQFPDVVLWMGDNPLWVERMGFAMAVQQVEVLEAIQRYRARARATGVLHTNEYILVDAGPPIAIHTFSARVVYVPVYDPWTLDTWVSGRRPFYSSWLSFSFGTRGYWGRYHIFWGVGIYDYGDPWWWGRWRNRALDWRVGRPVRWRVSRRADQPWARTGWRTSGWGTRITAPRARAGGWTTVRVNVALPASREPSPTGLHAPTWRQPTSPAAPITRWSRTTRTTPRPQQAPFVRPLPTPARRTPPQLRPTPRVIDPGPVRQWSRRGTRSLQRGERQRPTVSPRGRAGRPAPTQRPARSSPPARIRSFPPGRSVQPIPDARRVRAHDRRGHRALAGS